MPDYHDFKQELQSIKQLNLNNKTVKRLQDLLDEYNMSIYNLELDIPEAEAKVRVISSYNLPPIMAQVSQQCNAPKPPRPKSNRSMSVYRESSPIPNELSRERSDSEKSIGLYDCNIDEFEEIPFKITLKECQLLDPSSHHNSEANQSLNESNLVSKSNYRSSKSSSNILP